MVRGADDEQVRSFALGELEEAASGRGGDDRPRREIVAGCAGERAFGFARHGSHARGHQLRPERRREQPREGERVIAFRGAVIADDELPGAQLTTSEARLEQLGELAH